MFDVTLLLQQKCRCAIYFMFYHAEAGKHPLQITLFGDLSIWGDYIDVILLGVSIYFESIIDGLCILQLKDTVFPNKISRGYHVASRSMAGRPRKIIPKSLGKKGASCFVCLKSWNPHSGCCQISSLGKTGTPRAGVQISNTPTPEIDVEFSGSCSLEFSKMILTGHKKWELFFKQTKTTWKAHVHLLKSGRKDIQAIKN